MYRNSGGDTLLAYTIFKSFFPDLTPFGGSRRRSFPLANVIGTSISEYWALLDENNPDEQIVKDRLDASEWVILTRLNAATGRNFSSWTEYLGPVDEHGDTFCLTERYDLANEVFDRVAFDEWVPTMYLNDATGQPNMQRSWDPDQIVILTDGLCASACALFVEFMTRAGVRTIVAGGRPSAGPMQAVGGNRGAATYSATELDQDMAYARGIDFSVDENVNASVPDVRDPGMYARYISVNLRDQIRQNETTPLQFKYEAADCRIYYTLANLYNMTRLWHDVATAAFTDSTLCVAGSTGFSTTNNTNPATPPKPTAQRPVLDLKPNENTVQQIVSDEELEPGLRDSNGDWSDPNAIVRCSSTQPCRRHATRCETIDVYCGNRWSKAGACLHYGTRNECPGDRWTPVGKGDVKVYHNGVHAEEYAMGICEPYNTPPGFC
ncbi:hypothetical protein N0V83_004266 [Neocucurbitaria cava]|uniref:Tail specific protease domain-containing protein n=1 Tax=Neocucurbitaria cava TaxID=798079 RepID=A0A9W8YBM3_9PLEO|nr:hypothetical protein N0V83_004266 [Neocucurbitaria cava]